MAVTPVPMYRNTLPTSSGTLATVTTGKTWVITNIVLTNTSGSAATVTLNLDGVALLSVVPLAAGSTTPFDLRQSLGSTKTITGAASVSGVACHISGAEVG